MLESSGLLEIELQTEETRIKAMVINRVIISSKHYQHVISFFNLQVNNVSWMSWTVLSVTLLAVFNRRAPQRISP